MFFAADVDLNCKLRPKNKFLFRKFSVINLFNFVIFVGFK
ncbi:hypothetical protein EVA_05395 [gut metagenome]|uniref:Uncharacterized protein n=1 Tax=gut metagenome TaxID=749906 RepID=J9GHI1_9ZZZZ